jgi:ADP-ribosylglycohydrolase
MNQNKLYGAILGDLAGQPYEFKYKGDFSEFNIHDERSTFTDDTIMTLATAQALIEYDHPDKDDFEDIYKRFGFLYQGDYYGSKFKEWLQSPEGTTGNSWGNGALMRLGPILYGFKDSGFAQFIALESAFSSHFSPEVYEAVKGYMFLGTQMGIIKRRQKGGRYDDLAVPKFEKFDSSAETSINFVGKVVRKTNSTHEAIELAVKAGGDTDTNASIAAELCANYYNDITEEDKRYVESKLDPFLLDILKKFNEKYK